jgi:pimeloyl-ACP methyl ester carboxylesterase
MTGATVKLELISIETETYPLDGILYTPSSGAMRQAAMFLHGNCHNFYMGPSRFMPETLIAGGIACLAFNRRGHDVVTSLSGRDIGGGAFQLAAEALADNRYAAAWLRRRGFSAPIVIGHSNGGVLATQYAADHPDTPAVVLMSAHRGGRGITARISEKGLFARGGHDELVAAAERMIAEGRGKELMLLPGWWWVASAECIVDYANNMPDILDNAGKMRMPVLVMRGAQEPLDLYPAEEFAARCASRRCDLRILAECDHFYTGHEKMVSKLVADWLREACNPPPALRGMTTLRTDEPNS